MMSLAPGDLIVIPKGNGDLGAQSLSDSVTVDTHLYCLPRIQNLVYGSI